MGLALEDGSRVAIVGGGPAGSLCAFFLLTFARRMELDLRVDVYEPRDFTAAGPAGCNMCGGIVSESLVQALAIEGIPLPGAVVQRGIDSYQLHTDAASLRIATPLHEKRIAAVHRGGGPRNAEAQKWGGLDGYLLGLARELGARVIHARVTDAGWEGGRPRVRFGDRAETYDLLVGATGVNASGLPLFEKLGVPARRCETVRTYVTEIGLGSEAVTRQFGNAAHMFLLDIPRLDCAAIIPKGNYVTVCLLGSRVDDDLVGAFFRSPAVRRCFPEAAQAAGGSCRCMPRINVREASRPFVDRVVLIGDCGVSRLYKDGIGAAYRTAKAAARTAVFSGVSASDFRRHYWPVYRKIAADNRFGKVIFAVVRRIKAAGPLLRGVMRMSEREQAEAGGARRMSVVLWDMFTGSAPYREIFKRTLDARFLARFLRETFWPSGGRASETAGNRWRPPVRPEPEADGRRWVMTEGELGRDYADGEIVCRQGEAGDRMYVIQSGRAVVLREQDGVEGVVGSLGPGDVFGEMSLFEREPRSATVRAVGAMRVLTLDRRAFLRHVNEDPSLAYRILQQMSRRIRRLDAEASWLLSHAGRPPESGPEDRGSPPGAGAAEVSGAGSRTAG
jgi:flavin-dependent dehydrogenase